MSTDDSWIADMVAGPPSTAGPAASFLDSALGFSPLGAAGAPDTLFASTAGWVPSAAPASIPTAITTNDDAQYMPTDAPEGYEAVDDETGGYEPDDHARVTETYADAMDPDDADDAQWAPASWGGADFSAAASPTVAAAASAASRVRAFLWPPRFTPAQRVLWVVFLGLLTLGLLGFLGVEMYEHRPAWFSSTLL